MTRYVGMGMANRLSYRCGQCTADEQLPARRGLRLTSQIDLVCYGPRALCTLTVELPSGTIYVMTLGRIRWGIRRMMADFRHKSAIPNP